MTFDIWLTQHLDHILPSGNTLYQQLENVDTCWHQIYQHICDEYCIIALVDTCRIFPNNQQCILCIGDDACAIITITNGAAVLMWHYFIIIHIDGAAVMMEYWLIQVEYFTTISSVYCV